MSPLAAPPGDLAHFPRHLLAPATFLARVHRADRGAWWFSADGSGRFDLPSPQGTCYLGESALAGFLVVFGGSALVAEPDVLRRRVSWPAVSGELALADCTVGSARAFGVTGAIHSTPDYALTQAWARAFAAAGFAGVRYRVSHDPEQRLVGVALFGPAGAPADGALWPPGEPQPIGSELLREARERFGILVLPEL